jgi:hypothetical protein
MPRFGTTRALVAAAALVLFAACSPLRGRPAPEQPAPDGVSFNSGAIVLTGSALRDGPGTLLATMAGKIPNFRIKRNNDRCPDITLRGQASFQQISNPKVFVDGTRATDTCILESLAAVNVERVEVYPQGYTTRPGYGTHGPGLILVFMRSS